MRSAMGGKPTFSRMCGGARLHAEWVLDGHRTAMGGRAMVKPVKFAHVVYMTRRFDEMIAWYRNVFEADVVYENPALAFLTYDDEHHRFAIANLDVLKPGGKSRDER